MNTPISPRAPIMPWAVPTPPGFPPRFETPIAVEKEDHRRIGVLRKFRGPNVNALADRLAASDFHENEPTTMASSRFMRLARTRIISTAAPLLERRALLDGLFLVTIIPPSWFTAEENLLRRKPKLLRNQLRAMLHRAGIYDTRGLVIGHLDAAYVRQPSTQRLGFQFHMHLVCDANALVAIERMRGVDNLTADDDVAYPLRVDPILEDDLHYVLGYCFKSFWRCRAINQDPEGLDDVKRPRGSRLPDKAACREWLWRDRTTLADSSLVIGTRNLRRAFRQAWQ